MWGLILLINSIIFTFVAVFFIYSIGAAILLWHWKMFVIALLLLIFCWLAEVALAAIAEP